MRGYAETEILLRKMCFFAMNASCSDLFLYLCTVKWIHLDLNTMTTDPNSELFLNDHIDDFDEAQTARLVDLLPEWRREQALAFKHLQGRRECAAGYVELLRGLRQRFGVGDMPSFALGEHGKPFLREHPDIQFSISHCRVAVGCLLSTRPCGFDVERIRRAKPELVRYTMSPAEADEIFASPCPDIAFTRLWTQKEAVLKLRGTGIVDDLHAVLSPDSTNDISLKTTENILRGYIFTTAIQN